MLSRKKAKSRQVAGQPAFKLVRPPGGYWEVHIDKESQLPQHQLLRYQNIAERHGLLSECFADPGIALIQLNHVLRTEGL